MMSAFSMGRITSLVIDIGTAGTSITPIVEGYELKKSTVYTCRGGNLLDSMINDEINRRTGGVVRLWFDRNRAPNQPKLTAVTTSYREFHVSEVVQDVKQWMCFVPHHPITIPADVTNPVAISRLRDEELQRRLLSFPPPYELPDGTLVFAGESICTLPEKIFFPSFQNITGGLDDATQLQSQMQVSAPSSSRKRTRELIESTLGDHSSSNSNIDTKSQILQHSADSIMTKLGNRADMESLTDLVYASVAHADPDVRRELLSNIQIVGGGSLLQGLSNRLVNELNAVVPSHMKVSYDKANPINTLWSISTLTHFTQNCR